MNVLALVLAVLALGIAVVAVRRADVVENRTRRWLQEPDRRQPDPQLGHQPGRQSLPPSAGPGLTRLGVVRYDAFEDVGGRLSFSVALLDERGTGIVLTAIHGRSETRSYVKEVPVAADARELSPEESQAVSAAMKSRPV